METEKNYYRNALISLMAIEDEMIGAGMPMTAVELVRDSISICKEDYHRKFDDEDLASQ